MSLFGTILNKAPFSGVWADLTAKPTTLAGYGITDAAAAVHVHTESFIIAAGGFEVDSVADTGVARFVIPYAFSLAEVHLDLAVAPVGSTYIVDINKNGTSILSTLLTVDAGETSSRTAAVAAVIDTSSFVAGDVVTIDIDQVGSGTAGQEPVVTLVGTQA